MGCHPKQQPVTVRHIDENEETFSSFDRFLIYDSSKTAPVESIVYEFNVLIRIKGFDKPQNYKTRVRILSRLALAKHMEDDSMPPFFPLFRQPTILVEVEYVDYVIARNMLGMAETWVNEV